MYEDGPTGTPVILRRLSLRVVSINIEAAVQVEIDIKPGSDPNSINCNNYNEVITVAIPIPEGVDPTIIEPATVSFEGATETHINKNTYEPRQHYEDVDGDGDLDAVFHFRLGDTGLECSDLEATLVGQTLDGIHFGGN